MKSIVNLLKSYLEDCSPSEKGIAEYVLKHPKKILTMNISELARESQGSTAAIVRLCKRIKIDGYQELKILLARDIYSEKKAIDYPDFTFTKEDGSEGILSKILHMHSNNLETLGSVLDTKQIELTVDKIIQSEYVHLAGIGASGIAASDLHQKFLRIGVLSGWEQDSHLQLTAACTLSKKNVALFFSYSGETKEIIQGAKLAKDNGAYTIAITKMGGSELSKICDSVLYVPFSESTSRHGAVLSKINQLIIVDVIYTCLVIRNAELNFEMMEKTRKGVHQLQ